MRMSVRKSALAWCASGAALLSFEQPAVAQVRDTRPMDQETSRRLETIIPTLKESLRSGNADAQKAALTLLADVPPALVARADLGPAIRTLLEQKPADPEVVPLALRAFGKSYPVPGEIDKTFKLYEGTSDPAVQQALADAAAGLVASAAPASKSVRNVKPFADIAVAAIPHLSTALAAAQPKTRLTALRGYQTIATVLSEVFAFESNPGRDFLPEEPKTKVSRWEPLEPLLKKLDAELPKFDRVLNDPDPATRLTAVQVVETFANARRGAINADAAAAGFGGEGFKALVAPLSARLTDADPKIRLAAVEALEPLGAGIVAPGVLIPATSDPDLYVRWAAVRGLGRLAPAKEGGAGSAEAVAALANRANDPDVDLRSAALLALQRYGSVAKAAGPEIVRAATTGDVETRIIAMRTLVALKLEPGIAVPALIDALDDDLRLAKQAAVALGGYGSDAKAAAPELRKALSSSDQELRLAAGEALLLIASPKKPKDF